MAYETGRNESAGEALRRIADEQVSKALRETQAPDDVGEAVHEARKRCKKMRALLRLFRDGLGDVYGDENIALRDAARRLSGLRDADVVLQTHDWLVSPVDAVVDRTAFGGVRAGLERRLPPRPVDLEAEQISRLLGELRMRLLEIQARIDKWSLCGDDIEILRKGARRTYKRAHNRRRRAAAEAHAASYHEWRKRAKYHWLHMRLLRPISETARRRCRAVHELTQMLGDAHDLYVYETWLNRVEPDCEPAAIDALRAMSLGKRCGLEHDALRMGGYLFETKPSRFTKRLGL